MRNIRKNSSYKSEKLTIVRDIVYKMLNGYSDLRIEMQPVRMRITDSFGNDLNVTQMSGGCKAVFALVSDIVSRLALANPNISNPLLNEAVVLIDELDLHIHPKWQKTIVSDLKNIFLNIQFIITTHSPVIIQSLDATEVINLEKVESYAGNYKGWSIDEIQEFEMGVEKKSPEYLELLKEFEKSIGNNEVEKAKELYRKLDQMLYPSSEVKKILRLDMTSLGVSLDDKT